MSGGGSGADPWRVPPMLVPDPSRTAVHDGDADPRPPAPAARPAPDDADGGGSGDAQALERVCDGEPHEPRRRMRGIITVAVVACALCAAAAGGLVAHARHRDADLSRAAAECRAALDGQTQAAAALRAVLDADDTARAAAIGTDDVDGTAASLVGQLAGLLDTPQDPDASVCAAGDPGRLREAASQAASRTTALDGRAARVGDLAADLLAAHERKLLAAARSGYDASARAARDLLASSDGKVADAATRTALDALLARGTDTDDVAALERRTDEIDKACDRVRASMKDRERREREERERRAATDTPGTSAAASGTSAADAPAAGGAPTAPADSGTAPAPAWTPAPRPGAADAPPSWSVPADPGDGALAERDPGL